MEWKTYKLKDLVEIKYGKDHKKLAEGNIPVYGSGGIMRYADKFLYDKSSILIPRKGTLTNLFYVQEPFWTVDTMFWTKINRERSIGRFLYYLLKTYDFSLLDVGAAIPSLTTKVLNQVPVKIPKSLIAQRKIAGLLSAYDDLIENNLKRITLLEEQAQLTYEEWFVRMKFPGHESTQINQETGLPEGWEKKKIGELIEVGRGSSPRPISDQKYFMNGDIPWLKIADATASNIFIYRTKQHVNSYGASFSRKLPIGSIVVAASGTLGFPMILQVESCIHDGWLYFKGINDELKEYFYFSFIGLRRYFESISYGAAIQNINTNIVKQSPFIVPDIETSLKFKKVASTLFDSIRNLQHQNQLLKEARDILLPRLMTGMIDVENAKVS